MIISKNRLKKHNHKERKMKKNQLAGAALILLILTVPFAALAGSSVSKLKHAGSPSEYGAIFEEILDQGDASVNELLALLKEEVPAADPAAMEKDWAARVTAMNLLGEMKSQSALNLLGDMLENSDNVSAIYNPAGPSAASAVPTPL
jgi:hypothetical protein